MKNNVPNLPKEQQIMSPTDNKQLLNTGIEFTNNNVSVDIYAATDGFIVSLKYLFNKEHCNFDTTMRLYKWKLLFV